MKHGFRGLFGVDEGPWRSVLSMQSDPALPAEKHGLAYKQVIVEGRVPRAWRTCLVRLLKHPCISIVEDGKSGNFAV